MKIKVSEATKNQLNWMVATIEGGVWMGDWYAFPNDGSVQFKIARYTKEVAVATLNGCTYSPTTDWSQGGPIFSGARIGATFHPEWEVPNWGAWVTDGDDHQEVMGETELIAKARCYVSSKLGEFVEVPDELASEVYCVERTGDFYQSVFPSEESELSQLHSTVQDALDYFQEVKPGVHVEVPDDPA